MYGFALPPNFATRLAPPKWTNCRAYIKAGTYNDFVVPQNVYQLMICVWGAGGGGALCGTYNAYYTYYAVGTGGDGGGYAQGILDVLPGQILPTITIGAGGTISTTLSSGSGSAGGTSSVGTLLTATGGAGGQSSTSTSAPTRQCC